MLSCRRKWQYVGIEVAMRVQGLASLLRLTPSFNRSVNALLPASCPSHLSSHFHGGHSHTDDQQRCSANANSNVNGNGRGNGSLVAAFSFASFSFSAAAAMAKDCPPSEFIPKDLILYQYEACPFCNKVKAFLDYYDLPYKVIEVNPISKNEIKWSDYKKVPILMVDGKQLNDSSAIIDDLDKRIHPEKERLLTKGKEEEEKWRRWVDEHLVHVLSPNIYRSASEALESFDYITRNGNFTTLERLTGKYVGAAAMYFVSKKLKKKYNIKDERASLYEAADTWVKALDNRMFMGGSKPNLADLAVFGVLRPIRYLQSGRDMIANTNIGAWYSRMDVAVGGSSGIKDKT